jgi:hypothetical protein
MALSGKKKGTEHKNGVTQGHVSWFYFEKKLRNWALLNAGGAAHILSGGANNVNSTADEKEPEATGGLLVSRFNGNIKCQRGPIFCYWCMQTQMQ